MARASSCKGRISCAKGRRWKGSMPSRQRPRRADQERTPQMANPVDYAINHARLTDAALVFLLVAGLVAYLTIPKEAEPDVKIPIIYGLLSQRGISPEDAERLLIKPVE